MDQRAFGAFLLDQGVISARTLEKAREYQSILPGRLDTVLLGMGAVSESSMLKALGGFLKSRTVSGVELATTDPVVARILSPRVARRFMVAPYRKEGNRLSIASMLPLDLLVEDELALLSGCMVSSAVALEVRMAEFLARHAQQRLTAPMVKVLKILRGETTGIVVPRPQPRRSEAPADEPPGESGSAAVVPESRAPEQAAEAPPAARPKAEEPSELEIDDEDLELFPSLRASDTAAAQPPPLPPPLPPPKVDETPPAAPEVERSPEERLAMAAEELQGAEMRDDIADVLLEFCQPYLRRRLLLVVRKGAVVGWRGEGEEVDETAVRAISIPLDEASVFMSLAQGTSFWLGALPPMPRNLDLILGLGGDGPKDCLILPISVKSKIVCFLYGDNLDRGVAGAPMALLRRLIAKASLAFQVYLLKSKIRLM